VAHYAKWFLARLRTLEGQLAEQDYLCAAGRFTAADVSVGYALMLADHLDLSSRFTPAVTAYWERLQARQAFKRALDAQRTAALRQSVSILPAPQSVPD
jgi:glutathione S-transferase